MMGALLGGEHLEYDRRRRRGWTEVLVICSPRKPIVPHTVYGAPASNTGCQAANLVKPRPRFQICFAPPKSLFLRVNFAMAGAKRRFSSQGLPWVGLG